MSLQKRTRKNLSIETKLQLLADVDKKQSTKKEIAEKYGIPHNMLSTILKNRAKLERPGLTTEFQPDRKRQRTTEKLDIDQALFLWFKQARAMSAPLSNPILTSQAELIAQELGMKDFTASVGWIERFKRRHGIALRTVSGEGAAVDCINGIYYMISLPTAGPSFVQRPPRHIRRFLKRTIALE
ncbi:tigger transposable element-derived protein 4 [Plakobranchus ocellatus]|uniref:Tigger transposable element-derived protein 4 n=1 Tax=Plakobranchus ocellatus TaxID=259542 RepID=A0AAV3XX93_9GAST|nr:tigger transposable element-derived protein 4 [Plakobranchus ocellatus]